MRYETVPIVALERGSPVCAGIVARHMRNGLVFALSAWARERNFRIGAAAQATPALPRIASFDQDTLRGFGGAIGVWRY